jgi:hypothetical protein
VSVPIGGVEGRGVMPGVNDAFRRSSTSEPSSAASSAAVGLRSSLASGIALGGSDLSQGFLDAARYGRVPRALSRGLNLGRPPLELRHKIIHIDP